jgi:hypothetical protein
MTIAHGADTNLANPIAYYGVVKFPSFAAFNVPFSKNQTGASSQYSWYTNVPGFGGRIHVCIGTAICVDTGAFVLSTGTWYRIVWSNGAVNGCQIYVDNVNKYSGGVNTPTANAQSARIGNRIDGLYCGMDVAEMGFFNRELSGSELTDLDNYLTCKYNL